jgi:hypothetical protein
MTADVELSEEMFIITKETAETYLKTRASSPASATAPVPSAPIPAAAGTAVPVDLIPSAPPASSTTSGLTWTGEIPPQKVDEFLHESSFQVCLGAQLEADGES